jgi:hypothetical protein
VVREIELAPQAPPDRQVDDIVQELRKVVDAPDCALYRPSELLTTDPNLHCISDAEPFKDFIEDQLRRDFVWTKQPPRTTDTRPLGPWLSKRLTRAWQKETGRTRASGRFMRPFSART